jgi:uncharacterized protein YndB with AHSA1/START domain
VRSHDRPAFELVMSRVIDAPRARVFKGRTATQDQLQALAESEER